MQAKLELKQTSVNKYCNNVFAKIEALDAIVFKLAANSWDLTSTVKKKVLIKKSRTHCNGTAESLDSKECIWAATDRRQMVRSDYFCNFRIPLND